MTIILPGKGFWEKGVPSAKVLNQLPMIGENIPSRGEAEELFRQLGDKPYTRHSRNVAFVAGRIGRFLGLKENVSYVAGLLHDYGKNVSPVGVSHLVRGYDYMMELGYSFMARICITHGFAFKRVCVYANGDSSEKEKQFVQSFLDATEYTDYDKLIQLADLLADEKGVCDLEDRIQQFVIRYGATMAFEKKCDRVRETKEEFEKRIGISSIYKILNLR